MIKPWRALSTKELFKTTFFRFRSDQAELPDGRVMPNYYVMEFPDWVNIVPITEDNKLVMVEQYRHANGQITLEFPGGSSDPRLNEDAKRAALRELVEETGYVPDEARLIGVQAPNPAMQNNKLHTYIGLGCKKLQEPKLDPFEDIRVVTLPIPEVIDKVLSGEINHSVVVASLLYALPMLGFHLPRISAQP
ncbi:MAG: NUDIX hydrolase [Proteobacteria bacterium]|nr:MAG: NUDIX hydrolase [Pseudomonadota bacterium]